MAAVIPGNNSSVQPNVFSRVRTRERVNFISGGTRVVAIMGEGETEETLVDGALGGGADGWNSDFTAQNNPTGRHFQISKLNLVENRTTILKNNLPLTLLEEAITSSAFDSRYDARVDPATGRVELQRAKLADFGTDSGGNTIYFSGNANNAGNGSPTVTSSSLVDSNAPAETWTCKIVSVVKDGYGNRVSGEATITVTGTVSGQILDSNGNPYTWKSDGVYVNNGILNIAFAEGSSPFDVGDRFTLRVESGVLSANDKLVAKYIAEENLNDPEAFFSSEELFSKHGYPSEDNNLSLGAQLAYENGAPLVVAVQTKPAVPRKTSETLVQADNPLTTDVEGATGGVELGDTIWPLALGALPDADTAVNIFVVSSDGSEEQIILTKYDFYDTAYTTVNDAYTNFVQGAYSSAYTVFSAPQIEQDGVDGYVAVTSTTEIVFTSDSINLTVDNLDTGEGDLGKKLILVSPSEVAGTYTIDTIGDGYGNVKTLTATLDSGSLTPGDVIDGYSSWQIQDLNDTGAYLAVTDDVALNYLTAGKGLRISYVDTRDADFFDTNWSAAYEALERFDVQIICPLPKQAISNIFLAGKTHCETMSNIINQRERILIIGAQTGLDPEHVLGDSLAAVEDIGILEGVQGDDPEEILAGNIEDLADYDVQSAFGDSFRVIYMYPDQIVRSINGQNTLLPGFYMSPALGGYLGGQTNIAQPPTYKTLNGFSILRDRTYRQVTLNRFNGAGILCVVPVAGGGQMLHAVTTVSSGAPEEEEVSIVGIRDQVARTIRASLRPFIGRVQSPTLIPELNQGIGKLLRALVSQGLLAGFGSITVARNAIEPRQIDISVLINPVGPVNWVFVDMTVSL